MYQYSIFTFHYNYNNNFNNLYNRQLVHNYYAISETYYPDDKK